MKKSLLMVGAASLVAAMLAAGCASTEQQASFVEEVKKAEAAVANARGLEEHTKQPEKYLLPNVLLEQTKVLYINWAAIATDAIELRFGDADVISVARDAMDSANLKSWDALRNADANKEQADAAAAELKKFIAESYAKNKTTSKLSDDQIFDTVVDKIAQEDYVAYKELLKAGEVKEEDYKDQKTWLERGKANIVKVAEEQKKRMEAAEKRLAKAEEDAEEAKRKVALTVKYYTAKGAFMVAESQAKGASNPLVKKGFELTMGETKKLMDEAEKEFPEVTTVFELPPMKLNTVQDAMNAKAAIEKELKPWVYASEIGGKRWDSFWEVKKWAKEAQKTLDEVSGE